MLVAVDVGNSRVKLGLFDGKRLLQTRSRDAATISEIGDLASFLDHPDAVIDAIVAVSVGEETLAAFLEGPGRGALVLGRDLPILVGNRYHRPEEVGRDRLANAAAAFERVAGPAIVADLGSAATVDLVSESGEFLGGAIGPGLRALALGLGERAPALPPWDGESPEPGVPLSTREAIRSGIVDGLAGVVGGLARKLEKACGRNLPLLLTGGDAERIAPFLDRSSTVVLHLTLSGVRILYDRAGRA